MKTNAIYHTANPIYIFFPFVSVVLAFTVSGRKDENYINTIISNCNSVLLCIFNANSFCNELNVHGTFSLSLCISPCAFLPMPCFYIIELSMLVLVVAYCYCLFFAHVHHLSSLLSIPHSLHSTQPVNSFIAASLAKAKMKAHPHPPTNSGKAHQCTETKNCFAHENALNG